MNTSMYLLNTNEMIILQKYTGKTKIKSLFPVFVSTIKEYFDCEPKHRFQREQNQALDIFFCLIHIDFL